MSKQTQSMTEHSHGKRRRGFIRRALCLLFALALLWQPEFMQQARAGNDENNVGVDWKLEKGRTEMIRWKRIYKQEDLPQKAGNYYAFMAWSKEGWHYLRGGWTVKRDDGEKASVWNSDRRDSNTIDPAVERMFPRSNSAVWDEFYTLSAHDMPMFEWAEFDTNNGKEGNYDGFCTYNIRVKSTKGSNKYDKYLFCDNDNLKLEDSAQAFGVAFYGRKDYGSSVEHEGAVAFYVNRSGKRDVGIETKEAGYARGDGCDTGLSYDDFDEFYLWIGTPTTLTAITMDYTVEPGKVMNIDGNVVIMDGVTVKVAAGGVLSVEGNLINNGEILNYGTIVVQDGAKISTFDPKKNNSGAISNFGSSYTCPISYKDRDGVTRKELCEGKMIVMKNAIVAFSQANGDLTLKGNAYLLNYGTVSSPKITVNNSSFIENRGNLALYYGHGNMNAMATTRVVVASQPGQFGFTGGVTIKSEETSIQKAYDSRLRNYGNLMTWLSSAQFASYYPNYEQRQGGCFCQGRVPKWPGAVSW